MLCHNTFHLPRSVTTAGTASSTAAMLIRIATAAAGDHPVSMSDVANVPDVPKVAAENRASTNPARVARGSITCPPLVPRPCTARPPTLSSANPAYDDDTTAGLRQESTCFLLMTPRWRWPPPRR